MNKSTVLVCASAVLVFLLIAANVRPSPIPFGLIYPASWPEPLYDFSQNPLTPEGIELGRKLFYEPMLSKDGTISCANCHLSYTAFTHVDHALSHGIGDSIGTRNSLALMNLAWSSSFMWDGAVNHLDMQALAPISHPNEMGETLPAVISKLQNSSAYPGLFQEAFGDSLITGEHFLKAFSQFELTLISSNSKYDQVKRNEPGVEFSEQEQRGYQIFQQQCASCHLEPLFTNGEFANNGLPLDNTLMDMGRMQVTQQPGDARKFKIPTLRNIEFSSPYMHDGRFKRLSQVLRHYTSGIAESGTLAPTLQKGLEMSSSEQVDVIAFLLTLSDKTFLFNPDHAFPRQ